MLIILFSSIVNLLPAKDLIHVQIKASNKLTPLRVVNACASLILILVDVARLVVVTLEECIIGEVSPLVILIVVSVILLLDRLFVGLFERLGRYNWLLNGLGWLGGSGSRSLLSKAEDGILGLSGQSHKANNHKGC